MRTNHLKRLRRAATNANATLPALPTTLLRQTYWGDTYYKRITLSPESRLKGGHSKFMDSVTSSIKADINHEELTVIQFDALVGVHVPASEEKQLKVQP